ncbi:MAG: hypothetical protein HS115_12520 [Spirochaetales bacterium]|nr:hypothetical protein [Spirochaetales bacterium]
MYSDQDLARIIDESVGKGNIISLQTYYLSEYGERVLNQTARSILNRFGRLDLHDIVYSSAKELVLNATKANLKRVIFSDHSLDPARAEEYDRGLEIFKNSLREEIIKGHKQKFKEQNLLVTATFYYSPDVLNIKVKNNFPLYPEEERRIRQKFRQALSFASLLDFYLEHGDESEGAGLGLTMVGILLDQTGIDKHSFTLYSNNKYNETAARLEIPLSEEYLPRRRQFEEELARTQLPPEELRTVFKPVM